MEIIEICARLKEARLKKGLSLKDVSSGTKIPPSILEKIESSKEIESITPFYLKSFLKLYASFLKEEELLNKIKASSFFKEEKKGLIQKIRKESEEKISFPPGIFKKISRRLYLFFLRPPLLMGAGIVLILIITISFFRNTKHTLPGSSFKKISNLSSDGIRKEKKLSRQNPLTKRELTLGLKVKSAVFVKVVSDGVLVFEGILEPPAQEIWRAKKELRVRIMDPSQVLLEIKGEPIPTRYQRRPATFIVTPEGFSVEK